MSSATLEPRVSSPPAAGRRELLLTAADLAKFPRQLPTGAVRWELFDGRVCPMSPPGYPHAKVGARIVAELLIQGEQKGLGEVGTEVGVVLRRNPDRVVGPDAVFLPAQSLPARLTPERYLETIPGLVVEVRSPNDSAPEVLAKVAEYHAAGVVLVWVLDPDARTVTAHRAGLAPHLFGPTDILTADDLVPGFSVPVEKLFTGS